jgi:NIPSNAP
MITLSIRYTFNPDKLTAFRTYVEAELGEHGPIARSGGKTLGYFLPTDFAGPTNEALGLIEFSNLAVYERYRDALADDPDHRKNISALEQSGAAVTMIRSIIHRVGQG